MWLAYGIIKSDLPIIITNAIALTFHGMMLFFKLKFKNKAGAVPAPAS
jgi:MtN3 and saliva related transmembrane protein